MEQIFSSKCNASTPSGLELVDFISTIFYLEKIQNEIVKNNKYNCEYYSFVDHFQKRIGDITSPFHVVRSNLTECLSEDGQSVCWLRYRVEVLLAVAEHIKNIREKRTVQNYMDLLNAFINCHKH